MKRKPDPEVEVVFLGILLVSLIGFPIGYYHPEIVPWVQILPEDLDDDKECDTHTKDCDCECHD